MVGAVVDDDKIRAFQEFVVPISVLPQLILLGVVIEVDVHNSELG